MSYRTAGPFREQYKIWSKLDAKERAFWHRLGEHVNQWCNEEWAAEDRDGSRRWK
jgi:hypothetical protein